MTDEPLFPPTPSERLTMVRKFVLEEAFYRERMAERHPEHAEYWQGRVTQANEALAHLAALAAAVQP